MGHTTGIVFDLTFKPDTPQTVLDLFEFLAGCPDFKYHSNAERNFCSLLMKCPEEFTRVMFDPRQRLDYKLFLLVTCYHGNINGWHWREFNKETRRFRSAGDCKYDTDDEVGGGIVEILDALVPYLVLKDTGTICVRAKHEHDFQESVYWFDHAGFCKSPGYCYISHDPNYPDFKDREPGWVFYGEFQPPMDYKELVKQGLHKRRD